MGRANPDPLAAIAHRLAGCIRLLSSTRDGEVAAAMQAVQRILQTKGIDIHALADRIESGGISEAYKQEVRAQIANARASGYVEGVKAAQARQHGSGDFHNADGSPDWRAIAMFCQRNKGRLANKHHDFIDDMAARTVWNREPTEKQHKYLHSLFFKLGGKIT